jgi:hypothetical protein
LPVLAEFSKKLEKVLRSCGVIFRETKEIIPMNGWFQNKLPRRDLILLGRRFAQDATSLHFEFISIRFRRQFDSKDRSEFKRLPRSLLTVPEWATGAASYAVALRTSRRAARPHQLGAQ